MSDRPWTVLAYIVADDDRTPDAHLNIDPLNVEADREKLALAGGTRATGVPVFCQIDFTTPRDSETCVMKGTTGTDGTCGKAPEENVATLEATQRFLSAGVKATGGGTDSRYAVVFWGHGTGPAGLFLDATPPTIPPQSLRIPDLRKALSTLPRGYADLVLFKDCWASSLEIAYELKDVARYVIASQGEVPIHGAWPYNYIFDVLQSNTNSPGGPMLRGILDALAKHYADQRNRGQVKHREEVPFAALTLDAAAGLAAPLSHFVERFEMADAAVQRRCRDIMNLNVVRGGNDSLLDVRNLCTQLRSDGILAPEALDLERAVNALVVDQRSTSLMGASLFCRRQGEKVEDETDLADSVSWRTYDHLALSTTGWSTIAFADRLQFT